MNQLDMSAPIDLEKGVQVENKTSYEVYIEFLDLLKTEDFLVSPKDIEKIRKDMLMAVKGKQRLEYMKKLEKDLKDIKGVKAYSSKNPIKNSFLSNNIIASVLASVVALNSSVGVASSLPQTVDDTKTKVVEALPEENANLETKISKKLGKKVIIPETKISKKIKKSDVLITKSELNPENLKKALKALEIEISPEIFAKITKSLENNENHNEFFSDQRDFDENGNMILTPSKKTFQVTVFNGEKSLDIFETEKNSKLKRKIASIDKNSLENIITNKLSYKKDGKEMIVEEDASGGVIITFVGFDGSHEKRDLGHGPAKVGDTQDKFSLKLGATKQFGKSFAASLATRIGPEQLGFLIGSGFDFSKYGRIMFVVEDYREKYEAEIYGKNEETTIEQYKGAGEYSVALNEYIRGILDLRGIPDIRGIIGGAYSKSNDKKLAERTTKESQSTTYTEEKEDENAYYIYTYRETIVKTYLEETELIGGKQKEFYAGLEARIGPYKLGAKVKNTNRKYNDGEKIGNDIGFELDGSMEKGSYNFRAGLDVDNYRKKVYVGVKEVLDNGFSIDLSPYYEDRDGENNFGGNISLSKRFGGGTKKAPKRVFPKDSSTWGNRTLEEVGEDTYNQNNDYFSLAKGLSEFSKANLSNRLDIDPKQHETKTLIGTERYRDLINIQVIPKVKEEAEETDAQSFESYNPATQTIAVGEAYTVPFNGVIIKQTSGDTQGVQIVENKITGLLKGEYTFSIELNSIVKNLKLIVSEESSADTTPPVAKPDYLVGDENEEIKISKEMITYNDKDDSGEKVLLTGKFRNPQNCTVSYQNESFTVRPKKDFIGNASFEYEISDKAGNKSWGKVNIEIVYELYLPPTEVVLLGTTYAKFNHNMPAGVKFRNVKYRVFGGNLPNNTYCDGYISGLTPNTQYGVDTELEVFNPKTGKWEERLSMSIFFKTKREHYTPNPDHPETLGAPSVSNITHNSADLSNNISDPDGVKNIRFYLNGSPTNSHPNNLNPNTSYTTYTEAEVYDLRNKTWKKVTSNPINFTTLDTPTPDHPETLGAPSVSNITHNSADLSSNINDIDGVRNVRFFLNGSPTNSHPSNLNPKTSYTTYTEAEVYNPETQTRKKVRSNFTNFSTLEAPHVPINLVSSHFDYNSGAGEFIGSFVFDRDITAENFTVSADNGGYIVSSSASGNKIEVVGGPTHTGRTNIIVRFDSGEEFSDYIIHHVPINLVSSGFNLIDPVQDIYEGGFTFDRDITAENFTVSIDNYGYVISHSASGNKINIKFGTGATGKTTVTVRFGPPINKEYKDSVYE